MKSPDARLGLVSRKIIFPSLVGLTTASIIGFALLNASQSTSIPETQMAPEDSPTAYPNTIEITREEALKRFGEEAHRKRALEESRRIANTAAAQLIFLDENGNRIPGSIADIPGAAPPPAPRGPAITWPGDGPGAGTVIDSSNLRVYTYVTKNSDGRLEKDFVTGSLEDAQEALRKKSIHTAQTAKQANFKESKNQ